MRLPTMATEYLTEPIGTTSHGAEPRDFTQNHARMQTTDMIQYERTLSALRLEHAALCARIGHLEHDLEHREKLLDEAIERIDEEMRRQEAIITRYECLLADERCEPDNERGVATDNSHSWPRTAVNQLVETLAIG